MRLLKNRAAFASGVFLICIACLAALAPWVTRVSYEVQNIEARLQGPSQVFWLGTDVLGRDLWSRIVYGARMSLAVGALTAVFALALGVLVGAWAGWRGGWIDRALMRMVDLFYTFPSLLLAILTGLILGRGFLGIAVAIGMVSWVTQARLVRAQVLQARELPYVEAARALGLSAPRIVLHHILPNLWGPILVSLSFQIPSNIMAESFLSFIGLGLQPPYSSWGTLAAEGFRAMRSHPHLIIFPGVALFITLLAFNYLGDGLRDWLDPRSESGLAGLS